MKTNKSENKEVEANPVGRPTKYNAKIHIDWARGLSMQGYTMDEIADRMLIARSTLYLWMDEYEEFMDAVKTGKDLPDNQAEASLFKKVVGFEYEEKKTIITMDAKGQPLPARIENYKKHFIPDTTAQIFWLKNRRPERWRDKTEVEVDLKNNDIEKMSPDELRRKVAELEAIRNAGKRFD